MKKLIIIIIILFPIILYGENRKYHIIKKGETLWRVSKTYKIPIQTLQKINNISNISKVKIGTKIYLAYPEQKKTIKPVKLNIKLSKPVDGEMINNFNSGENIVKGNGAEFITKPEMQVRPALPGTVIYTGNMKGYGNCVIIQYSKEISTLYAYLQLITAKINDKVEKENIIGITGNNNQKKQYILHFELLYNGKPVNPQQYF